MRTGKPGHRSASVAFRLARAAVTWLLSGGGSMKERALRGTLWLLLAEAVTRLAGVLKLAVLGRLLSPRDFGILGVALLIQQWIGSFTQTGLSSTLIQKNGEIRGYLNTAWTVGLIRGTVVFALIYALAPPMAVYFRSPESASIIRLTALLPLLWELANPGVIYLRRELDFRRDVTWRISGVVPGLLTGIVLAFVLRSAWALAASLVASRAAEIIASYRMHAYRPRLEIKRQQARELLRTGRWFSWINVAGFFEYQLDSLLTARWLGTKALGYYQVAAQLALLPTAGLGGQVAAVLFPAFARVEETERRRRAFLNALAALALVIVPLASALACFPETVVRLGLGARWAPIAAPLTLLAWAGLARGFGGVAVALLKATANLKTAMLLQLGRIFALGLLLYVLVPRFGFTGTAAAVTISAVLMGALQVTVASRILAVRPGEVGRALKWGALAGLPFPLFRLAVAPLGLYWHAAALICAGLACVLVIARGLKAQFGFTLDWAGKPALAVPKD